MCVLLSHSLEKQLCVTVYISRDNKLSWLVCQGGGSLDSVRIVSELKSMLGIYLTPTLL
jgi:hypothetical protein